MCDDSNGENNPRPKPKIFDISFQSIMKFAVIKVDLLSPLVEMHLNNNAVLGAVGLPSTFYDKNGIAAIDIPTADVFNEFGNIYQFNKIRQQQRLNKS